MQHEKNIYDDISRISDLLPWQSDHEVFIFQKKYAKEIFEEFQT